MWATVRDESLVIQQHLAMIVLGQNLESNEQWKCDGCDFLLSAETNLFHRIGWMGPGLEQALETQHPPHVPNQLS